MSTELLDDPVEKPRRSPWRQRLVDAETGLRFGIRADSTLFVFFFCSATVLLASLVMGLTTLEWAILILALGFALSAELLHQVLKQISDNLEGRFAEIILLGTTAVVAAHLTAAFVSGLLLWKRLSTLWSP
ncbi:diacylglycerol kinase [Planctomicrobium sp. SH661]|uniref:diacylglycerol kinase n=1 Tax=Planctomicrobium sp. SH661 TaxID=3448124 RepID=UPI003F5CB4AA